LGAGANCPGLEGAPVERGKPGGGVEGRSGGTSGSVGGGEIGCPPVVELGAI
jgi:hypothetical protein